MHLQIYIDFFDTHLRAHRHVTHHRLPSKPFAEGDAVHLFIFLVFNDVQIGLWSYRLAAAEFELVADRTPQRILSLIAGVLTAGTYAKEQALIRPQVDEYDCERRMLIPFCALDHTPHRPGLVDTVGTLNSESLTVLTVFTRNSNEFNLSRSPGFFEPRLALDYRYAIR